MVEWKYCVFVLSCQPIDFILFGLDCYKVRFADKCTYRTCSAKIVQFRGNINQFAKTP